MITVLSIAGYDPSGGAGVLADIKVISAFRCYGVAAITSLTIQNTVGVFGARHQSGEAVASQLRILFEDFDIAAVKVGMLPTRDVVESVVDILSTHRPKHIVVDPVMRSSSGFDLVDEAGWNLLVDRLVPLASVITPNTNEAERITGIAITGQEQMQEAAQAMLSGGANAVLITGGDLDGDRASDLLLDVEGMTLYSSERMESTQTHGTGCVFSSALACLLARDRTLREAIPVAKHYVAEGIRTGPPVGRGRGPLNHLPPGFEPG